MLDEEGYNARYASGHLIYGRAGVVMAVPFDAERLQVTGNPVQVLDRVVTRRAGAQAFAVSPNGTVAYVPSPRIDAELVWMDREGTFIEPVGAPVRPYVAPHLSPDGERIVVDVDSEAWMYNIEHGTPATLPAADRSSANPHSVLPSWSPDGSTIAFIVGGSRLYTAPADGSGSADLLWESPFLIWGPTWSPDGRFIVGTTLLAESGLDVWRVSLDDGQPAPYLQGADDTDWPVFSPSGSWVAYSSRASGQAEIYARPFPDSAGGRVEISAGGGTKPLWFDGELFYRRGERVVSVRIEETATNLRILGREQLPVVLPDEGDDRRGYDYDYDPVNSRFLVVRPVIENPVPRIYVVVNWLAEISAQMGARK
ncbi:MAG TPA: hypothetical protein VMR74_16090 [Gammaproteobacteria bacterium]|nr:hypothetical protein [Gammaproteobacteria bacterium]